MYSIDELARDKRTAWDGVRNYAARNHLRAMRRGDEVLVYHSMGKDPAIVGVAKVAKEAYPDPTATEGDWSAVDLAYVRKLPRPVALAEVKAEKALAAMALVRLARLSVQPVTEAEWARILEMAGRRA